MLYITSDLHFGHDREFIYKPRGFTHIQEHDIALIERWNSVVTPEDEVYILGDLMLNDDKHGLDCLLKLQGKKHVILGNHDTAHRVELYKQLYTFDIIGHATVLKYKKLNFYLSHYPTMTSNLEDGRQLGGRILNLYGHTHQMTNFYNDIPFMYHVGVDSHNCTPVSFDQVIEDMRAETQKCIDML